MNIRNILTIPTIDSLVTEIKKIKTIYKINKKQYKVLSIEDTVDLLLNGYSISRFGDGELKLIQGNRIGFQNYNDTLKHMLLNVLTAGSKSSKFLVAIPETLISLDNITKQSRDFWVNNLIGDYDVWKAYLDSENIYGNAFFSRCYLKNKEKTNSLSLFTKIRNIWDKRDVVLIEGYYTRAGIGNDLFDNVSNLKRIECPALDAFDDIEEIYRFVKNNINTDSLILICLGPTASILAYRLFCLGYQAIDLGHLDVEYSWFLNNVIEKKPISGKFVNEVDNLSKLSDFPVENLNEIIYTTKNYKRRRV